MRDMISPEFVLAGDATFTVSNGRGEHYTYHVYKGKPTDGRPNLLPNYFVAYLAGPDNKNDFAYLGMLWWKDYRLDRLKAEPGVRLTNSSKVKEGNDTLKVARWVLRAIWQSAHRGYRLPPGYTVKHCDKCGRCGQRLTTPESLDTGFGPDCAEAVGIPWKEHNRRQLELEGVNGK